MNLRRRLLLFHLALATIVLFLASSIPTSLAEQSSPSPLPAVSNNDPFFGAVQAIYSPDRALQAGVKWERLVFWWSKMQTDSPEQMQEGWFSDDQIDQEIARGITPVGVILSTPSWAARDPSQGPTAVPKNLDRPYDDPQNYWGQFTRRLATRYKGRIDVWIIWNEPDMYNAERVANWAGTPAEYFQLLKVAYLSIKEANPSATVVMAGLTYWWDKENGRQQYFEKLLDLALADPLAPANGYYFDVANVHTYGNPLNSFAVPTLFRRLMQARGIDKPIWVTEMNVVPYDDPMAPLPAGSYRATMDEQASYIIEALALARAAGVQRASVYKMSDGDPENGEYFGLVRNDGSVRPAYVAYQVAATYFSQSTSAVFSWTGSHNPPSEAQIDALLASGRDRFQFIWPGQVAKVVLDRPGQRVTAIWNTGPDTCTIALPAYASKAKLVDKYGRTQTIEAQAGGYSLTLEGTHNNSDPRDPSIYLVGGSPLLVVEDVEGSTPASSTPQPQPLTAVDAKIEIVWPHGGVPVTEAQLANISAFLFRPGTEQSVPCDWEPTVRLWGALDAEPARLIATGKKRLATQDGRVFPTWDFDDVDVSAARDPRHKLYFYLTVDGVATANNVWSHGADARTYFPDQDVPTGVGAVTEADAKVEIVWPHRNGVVAPVQEATKANVTVMVFQRGSLVSATPDWKGAVTLYRSLNGEPGEAVGTGQKRIVEKNGLRYPVWDFFDIDVSAASDPQNKYYFWARIEDVPTHSNVWSHGADARTYFPHMDLPLPACN